MLRWLRSRWLQRWLRSRLLRGLRSRWRQSRARRRGGSSGGALSEQAEDAIYRDLGRYVVTFQHLQNELVQLASFALDPTHSGHGRRAVADLPFRKLITKTRTSVGQFLDEHRGDEPEFREHLRDLLDRCGELADHRNKVVHSTIRVSRIGRCASRNRPIRHEARRRRERSGGTAQLGLADRAEATGGLPSEGQSRDPPP
jgi:hypothetical protein